MGGTNVLASEKKGNGRAAENYYRVQIYAASTQTKYPTYKDIPVSEPEAAPV